MKKKIAALSLVFCTINASICAQSTIESKDDNGLVSVYKVGRQDTVHRMVNSEQQRQLPQEDYGLWETLRPEKISNNGHWVSYRMDYVIGKDSLFLKNVNTNLVYAISEGINGRFSAQNHWFAYLIKGKGIGYIDLKTGQRTLVPKAVHYSFSANGDYLAIYSGSSSTEEVKQNTLLIKGLTKGTTLKIEDVSEYGFNQKGNRVVYFSTNDTGQFVAIRHLEKAKGNLEVITCNPNNSYHSLIWDKEGESFAFLEAFEDPLFKEQSHIVHQYRQEKLYSFDHRTHIGFPKDMYVSGSTIAKFLISKDAQRVFFGIAPWTLVKEQKETSKNNNNSADVQIWHWKDEEVYPRKHIRSRYSKRPKLSVWWPTEDRFMQIASQEHPETFLTGDQKHALTFHPQAYRPLFKFGEDYIDIYLSDLATEKKELFLKKQLNINRHTLTSPNGKYISYFKDLDWWVYNIKNNTHSNITERLSHPTYTSKNTTYRTPRPFGSPGWTKNDNEIIIYDEYDVWLISPDGASQKKLTNGRSSKTRHRIYEHQYKSYILYDFYGFECQSFNLDEGLMISTYGTTMKKSGYSTWNKEKGVVKMVYADKHINQLKKAKKKNSYVTKEQTFDTPPKLMLYSKNGTKPLVQSNPQHSDFHWGSSELIQYMGIKGDTLQGVLFYPTNYQTDKQYPMIVHIYEKQSQQLHHYVNPSLQMGTGFNPTVYNTNGYFVLYPDIEYTYNDPGISATKCVVSAVKQVLEQASVDKNRIGLLGHSFGGYETVFILTQTDLFAAAVAGASSIDLVSSYLSFYEDMQTPEINFFESSQFRFTGSFYQYPDAYLSNSPIHNLQNINTPLLSWHGAKDGRVNLTQGIELYNAMRRLEKEHVFLVYPNGSHILANSDSQIDLSKKILHWFDFKLKREVPMSWIIKGE